MSMSADATVPCFSALAGTPDFPISLGRNWTDEQPGTLVLTAY
jgi:hypothetical protein